MVALRALSSGQAFLQGRWLVPQLVIAAMLGAGLYAGYRYIARTAQKMADDARRAQEDLMRQATGAVEKNLGNLEYDPGTGVYRPSKHG